MKYRASRSGGADHIQEFRDNNGVKMGAAHFADVFQG